MAHRGLREADRGRQVTAAGLRPRAGSDEAQQSKPGGVGQCLKGGRQGFGVLLAERSGEQRAAARLDLLEELHAVILTDVDTIGNISTAIDTSLLRTGGDPGMNDPCCPPECCPPGCC